MDVCLSARGLRNIPFDFLPLDFKFLIGDHEYPCSSFLASFISPTVCEMLKADRLVDSFTISNISDNGHEFEVILKLMRGEPVTIDDHLVDYVALIGTQLGNSELVELSGKVPRTPISTENVCLRMTKKMELGMPYHQELQFLAQNICDIEEAQLKNLGLSLLLDVFSSPDLKIPGDRWLLSTICSIVEEKGPDYQILFSTVHFDNLSEGEMASFVQVFRPEHMNGAIWEALTQRLIRKVSQSMTAAMRILTEGIVCPPHDPEDFNGIIAKLKTTFNMDVPNEEILEMTCSSANEAHPLNFATDTENETSYFESLDEPDSWIALDFKGRRVSVTHYALKTWFWPAGYQHLKSWVLEGSDDGEEWTELDRREDCPHLNNPSAVKRFKCDLRIKCRHIRLRSTGPDHFGTNLMILSGIELYGRLTSPQP